MSDRINQRPGEDLQPKSPRHDVVDALTLRKCEWMGDWYVIERARHDGRKWMERTGPDSMSLRCSARFSDADVEGYAFEMLAIADAIERHEEARFKRCAVNACDDGETGIVWFWSPRNSQRNGEATRAAADALAKQIREMCAAPEVSSE